MPRTAPTVDGSPPFFSVTFGFIDASGDKRTIRIDPVPGPLADVQSRADTLATSLGDASNANLYSVKIQELYEVNADASAATSAVYESVYDNVVVLYKNASTKQAINLFIPAPVAAIVGNGDAVDTSDGLYIAARTNTATLLQPPFAAISTRFTERREKNDSTPA